MTPGIPPITPGNQLGFGLALVPEDAGRATRWLRRGRTTSSIYLPTGLRRLLLRLGGVNLGRSVWGLERVWWESPHITIGDGTAVGAECWFEGNGRIDIGANCIIGIQTMIITSVHTLGPEGEIARIAESQDVRIDDGSWLAARTTVLPGVHIGAGVVVCAGSVVTKDCEPGGVYGGVPARRLR